MKNATKIIDKLKEFLDLKTDTELAKWLGVHHSTVSGWRLRESLNIELILEKVKNVDLNWLLYDENVESGNDYSKVKPKNLKVNDEAVEYIDDDTVSNIFDIDVYDVPAYGSESGLVNLEEYAHSTKKLYLGMGIDPQKVKSIRIIGNSMEGSGINSNDYIFFRTDDKAYNNRQVLVNLNGALIVKTLKKDSSGIKLYSNYRDSSSQIEIGEDDHLEIIGVVIAVLSYR